MRRIDRLQETGLLTRHVSPDDHRRVRICLTCNGHAAMATMLEHLFDRSERSEGSGPKSLAPHATRPAP